MLFIKLNFCYDHSFNGERNSFSVALGFRSRLSKIFFIFDQIDINYVYVLFLHCLHFSHVNTLVPLDNCFIFLAFLFYLKETEIMSVLSNIKFTWRFFYQSLDLYTKQKKSSHLLIKISFTILVEDVTFFL